MDAAEHIPEVAVRHSRLESSAYGRLALGSLDSAITDEELVRPAGIVLAEGAWDYRESSTAYTPLYTDFHEPTFLYRAMLGNTRYATIHHETEGQESIFGKELYRAKVTLSNPSNMGRATVDVVRTDWENLDIQLRQADSQQLLAQSEPLRMDKATASDLLKEFLHLSKADPMLFQGIDSLEDTLTMMTHQSSGAESVRSLQHQTHRSRTGFTTASIEETTLRSDVHRPKVTHKLGVFSVFHIQKDPDISLATKLDFKPYLKVPVQKQGLGRT